MGPDGSIVSMEEVEKMSKKEQRQFIPLSKSQHEKLMGMNRADRRRYYREYKKAGGLSWQDCKKEKPNDKP